jgi:hypothetical protein
VFSQSNGHSPWQSIEVPAEMAHVVPSLEALLVLGFVAEFPGALGKMFVMM